MTIGERIKEIRKSRGLTQKELGERLGLSYQAIAQWENNLRNPKNETIGKIADALGVSISSILPEQPDDPVIDRLTSDFAAKLFAHMKKADQLDDEYNKLRGYDHSAQVDEIPYRPRYNLLVTLITENTLDHLDKCLTILLSDAEAESKLDAAKHMETDAAQNLREKE